MRVAFHPGQSVDLVNRAFLQFWQLFEFVGRDYFNRYIHLVAQVAAFIHFAVLPLSDLFVQTVVLNDFYHNSYFIFKNHQHSLNRLKLGKLSPT